LEKEKVFYITSPLYYVNAKPHIGHSYTQIICDCLSRYMRMAGRKVFFLTGTDEHGQKVSDSAESANQSAAEFVEGISDEFRQLWEKLDIKYDDFIRTTQKRHIDTVSKVLSYLYQKGDIYQGEYKGFYCMPCETFWSLPQLQGRACPDCKRPVEEISEKNYFFRLSKYQDWLIDYINKNPDFIKPAFRANEVLGYLREPLNDLCISRPKERLRWGIDIPFAKGHLTYVWFDALINYITACSYFEDKAKFNRLWPADIQVMGKDILRPHAVYWPIMLKALDIEPPKTIFAHGWWLISGDKISKSKGNAIDPAYLIDKYGKSAYRYFMMREISPGLDGTFSEEAIIARFNSDLANDIGNLLNRTLTMAEKYFNSVVPDAEPASGAEADIQERLRGLLPVVESFITDLRFNQALISIWEVINIANKHIELTKPWELAKSGNIKKLESVIFTLLKVLEYCLFLVHPFMPDTSFKIASQLGIELNEDKLQFKYIGTLLKPGSTVKKSGPIFPRIL
jgi:methionyl-tRNA synthetase